MHTRNQSTGILSLLFCLVLLSASLGPSVAGQMAQEAQQPYRTGARQPTPDEMRRFAPFIKKAAPLPGHPAPSAAALPSRVVNITYLPVVGAQQLNSCGTFAPTYYLKTWQEAKEHGWVRPNPLVDPEHVMSPGFTYPLNNGGNNAATTIQGAIIAMCQYGCASWKVMPENPFDWYSYPRPSQFLAAMPYRADHMIAFEGIETEQGMNNLKAHLAGGDLACFIVNVYYDVHQSYPYSAAGVSNDVIYSRGQELWDGHAFTLIGYDDNKEYVVEGETKKGAFLAVNSWGAGWGVQLEEAGSAGFVWFGYDYLIQENKGFYSMADRIGYQPTDVAYVDLFHEKLSELGLLVHAGPRLNPPIEPQVLNPPVPQLYPFTGTLVADLTDFQSLESSSYWLTVNDIYYDVWGFNTGEIKRFEVVKADGAATFTAQGVPLSTSEKYTTEDTRQYLYAGRFRPMEIDLDGAETGCYRTAWADFDNDGDPDLALVGGGDSGMATTVQSKLLRKDEEGFTPLEGILPHAAYGAVAWADYNRDGRSDLILTGSDAQGNGIRNLFKNQAHVGLVNSGASLPTFSGSGFFAWGDYDNDGDLDLAFSGYTDSGPAVVLLRNNNGTFANSGTAFPPMFFTPLSWCDANQDGWLDLLVGNILYWNNQGTLTDAYQFMIEGYQGCHAWGDFDNDGYPDLLITGKNLSGLPGDFITRIYRNLGGFQFHEINPGLPGVIAGSIALADYDRDGRLDLAMCGQTGVGDDRKMACIYRQKSDGTFADSGYELPGLSGGDLSWVDIDGDGDLDFMASGMLPTGTTLESRTLMLENLTADAKVCNAPNARPAAPGMLSAVTGANTSEAILQWAAPQDDKTPRSDISFNVRLGRHPGDVSIVSPANGLSLLGNHPGSCRGIGNPVRRITSLAPGRYYWSVQAIDAGMRTSEWSQESVLAIGANGIPNWDVNGDGVVDIADAVQCQKNIAQNPFNLAMDVNADGKRDALDPFFLRSQVMGKGGKGYLTAATATIGPEGGSLSGFGCELIVPAGAFDKSRQLTLSVSSTEMPNGPGMVPFAYKLTGFPVVCAQPIRLRMLDMRQNKTGNPWIAVGEKGSMNEFGTNEYSFHDFEAAPVGNGYAEVVFPASTEPARRAGLAAADPLIDDPEFDRVAVMNEGIMYRHHTAHCYVLAGSEYTDYLVPVGNMLEEAFGKFEAMGFDMTRRDWTSYPLEVTIRTTSASKNEAGLTTKGETASAYMWGNHRVYVNISKDIVSDTEMLRTTVIHELFHVIQYCYDPRSSYLRRTAANGAFWLKDACSTWSEWLMATDPNYLPLETRTDIINAFEQGFQRASSFRGYFQMGSPYFGQASDYGYGTPQMMAYLVNVNGDDNRTLKTLWDQIYAGRNSYFAIKELTHMGTGYWYHDMVTQFFKGELLNLSMEKLTGFVGNKMLLREAWAERSRRFAPVDMPDLSAKFYGIPIASTYYSQITNEDKFGFSIRSNTPGVYLSVFQKNVLNSHFVRLGEAAFSPERNTRQLIVPEIRKALLSSQKSDYYIAAVSNTHESSPYDSTDRVYVAMGLCRDYAGYKPKTAVMDEKRSISRHGLNAISVQWPRYTFPAIITVQNASSPIKEENFAQLSNSSARMTMDLWGDPPSDVVFNCDALCSETSQTFPADGGGHWTVSARVTHWKMHKYLPGPRWPPWEVIGELQNATGAFTLSLDKTDQIGYYVISAYLEYTTQYYDSTGALAFTDTIDDQYTPYSFFLYFPDSPRYEELFPQ